MFALDADYDKRNWFRSQNGKNLHQTKCFHCADERGELRFFALRENIFHQLVRFWFEAIEVLELHLFVEE
jgi:hypothetical protein